MKNLIDWYINYYRQDIVRADDELRSSFNLALTDKEKAILILGFLFQSNEIFRDFWRS